MNKTVAIEKCSGGYIYKTEDEKFVVKTTEELFDALLFIFEHRSKNLNGPYYGRVVIKNVKDD